MQQLFLIIILLFSVNTYSQSTDNVLILDEKGEALSGVSIFTKDYSFATTSDLNGHFVLPKLNGIQILHFTFIGFEELQLTITEIATRNFKIQMILQIENLTTVEVFGRLNQSVDEIPFLAERIGQEEIQLTNAPNPADALRNQGLFIQKSQLGGGSPIIRGFEANRVLLVIDGVRMNNAIYRSGHLQNAITPDASAMEQIEVIFGPGSLIYGSDALGGVVHFRLQDPSLSKLGKPSSISVAFMARYASAANEKSANLNLHFSSPKWAGVSNFSYSNFGDLKSGSRRPKGFAVFGKRSDYYDAKGNLTLNDNENIQRKTGYSQINFLQKIRFQPNEKLYFIASILGSFSSNIPRYDRLTERKNEDLKFKKWYYGPQNHIFTSLKTRVLQKTKLFDATTFITAWQRIDEDRFSQKVTSDWLKSTYVDVNVFSITADFEKAIHQNEGHTLHYGFDANHNDVQSHAFRQKEDGTIDKTVDARYPSEGSRYSSTGMYATYTFQNVTKNFNFDAGLRYTYTQLFAKFGKNGTIEWPQTYLDGITTQNDALTWSAGFNFQTQNKWKFRFLTATAFRSPNIDDFAKIREKNKFVTVPNPDLIPEKTFSVEGTIGKEFSFSENKNQLTVSATTFITRLKNAIVRQDFYLPDGSTFFISNGDTLNVQSNVNSTEAFITGISANIQFDWQTNWQFKSSINYVKGQRYFQEKNTAGEFIINELVPQDHIPPLYGKTALSFTKKKWKISAVAHYNAAKKVEDYAVSSIEIDDTNNLIFNRKGTADNIEDGTINSENGDFTGVYAWTTFNLYTSYNINKQWSINFAVENITDIHYRRFASGISASGRNFMISIRGRLGK